MRRISDDWLRLRRGEQLRSMRENRDVLLGWEWVAPKQARSCIRCLLMDGLRYDLDAEFITHDGCRCTLIGVIKGVPAIPRTVGRDWVASLGDPELIAILGAEAFARYRDGVSLSDLAQEVYVR